MQKLIQHVGILSFTLAIFQFFPIFLLKLDEKNIQVTTTKWKENININCKLQILKEC